jgi:hypothetical protein
MQIIIDKQSRLLTIKSILQCNLVQSVLIICCLSLYAKAELNFSINWSSVSNIPVAKNQIVVAAVDGKIYAMGGENSSFSPTSAVNIYDTLNPVAGWGSTSNLLLQSTMLPGLLWTKSYM